jgi:hypothetical protein
MSSFKGTTEPKKNMNVKELTAKYAPFWQSLFTNMGISSPKFGAKLCYNGKEFGEERHPCVRFWPSELSCGQDFYIECFDWDQEHYDRANRKLYRLNNNPNWKLNHNKYVEVETSPETITYAVKLSDLELVNSTPVTAAYAEVVAAPSFMDEPEEEFSGMFSEKEDTHMSAMTLRDHYCIENNVPLSNKKWLNDLIKEGLAWQQKNNTQK